MKHWITGIWIFCLTLGLHAQTLSYQEVEDKTLLYLQHQRWDELITTGEQALRQGMDYYYLRYRLGVAYYERAKYAYAVPHLQEAFRQQPKDGVLLEYLYFALYRSGQENAARALLRDAPEEVCRRIAALTPSNPGTWLTLEGGLKQSSFPGQSTPMQYAQVALSHPIASKKARLTHAYTFLGQQNLPGGFQQHQYYLGLNLPLTQGTLSVGGQVVGMQFEGDRFERRTNRVTRNFVTPNGFPATDMQDTLFTQSTTLRYAEPAGLLAVGWALALGEGWTLVPGVSTVLLQEELRTIESRRQDISRTITIYFPFGPPGVQNFSSTNTSQPSRFEKNTRLVWQANVELQRQFSPHWAWHQWLAWHDWQTDTGVLSRSRLIGQLTPKWGVTGELFYGNAFYMVESNGFLYSNSPDPTIWRASLQASWAIHPDVVLRLTGMYEQKRGYIRSSNYTFSSFFTTLSFRL